jgi:hypothetical protein
MEGLKFAGGMGASMLSGALEAAQQQAKQAAERAQQQAAAAAERLQNDASATAARMRQQGVDAAGHRHAMGGGMACGVEQHIEAIAPLHAALALARLGHTLWTMGGWDARAAVKTGTVLSKRAEQ